MAAPISRPDTYLDIELPKNSAMGPVIAAIGFALAFGLVWHIWWMAILSFLAAVATMIIRGFARDTTRIVTAQKVRQEHHRWLDAAAARPCHIPGGRTQPGQRRTGPARSQRGGAMSQQVLKYPGLNLGPAHGKDDDAAQHVIFGFWVFLMSDAMLFGMVFATYVTSLNGTAGGPGPHQLYDIKSTFIETLLLLASSFTFGMASLALKYEHGKTRLIGWLAVTLVLGVAFLGFELHDFSSMFAKGGITQPQRLLVGLLRPGAAARAARHRRLHLADLLVGQIARYGLDTVTKLGIMRLALFWHFLDIVWIAIFSVVYLAGLT